MKVSVSQQACIAAQQCSKSAPKVFTNNDDGFVELIDPNPPESEYDAVRQAENLCPSSAVHIDDGN